MKNSILIFGITLIITTTIGYVGYQVITNNDSTVNDTPPVIQDIVNLAENQQFSEAIAGGYLLVDSEELSEEEKIDVLNELTSIVLAAQNPNDPSDEQIVTLYAKLYELMMDENYSDLFRSYSVILVDRIFWETDFNIDYLSDSFDKNETFIFDDPYTAEDSGITDRYEIAYRVLYDINEYADNLNADKQLLGMQVWIVGTSVLSVEPPVELFDEFELYLEEQLEFYNNDEYTLPSSDFQRESLEMTIVSMKLNLSERYPDRFDFSN